MEPTARRRPVTAAQIRAVMLGRPAEGLRVVRQARRLTADDSDELVLIEARGSWWVARRRSDAVTVWAYVGDVEAEQGFESLVAAAGDGGDAWQEAVARLLQ